MTNVQSRPRLIAIGELERPPHGFVSALQVSSRGGTSHLVDLLSPEDGVGIPVRESARTLSDLLEAAWRADWRREVRRRAAELDAFGLLVENVLDATAAEIDRFAGLEHLSQPEQALLTTVARIASRPPTIIGLGKLDPTSRRFARSLASELKSLSVPELTRNRFCFAPLTGDAEAKKALRELLDVIVGSWTGLDLAQFRGRQGPILLIGPTGTGKTEFAKRLHESFCTDDRKFVKLNVGALTKDLLEARLRGYKRGAFTGAQVDTPGAFEKANGGTLFLDEFQNASPETQLQLLDLVGAVSDDVSVARMGDDDNPQPFRVKVIMAANEPLEQLLAGGKLRRDLYHRVRVVHELPTLNARLSLDDGRQNALLKRLIAVYRWKGNSPVVSKDAPEDMSLMFPEYDDAILARLRRHDWPGNLRELERVCFDLNWKREQEYGEADVPFLNTLLHRHADNVPSAPPHAREADSIAPARVRRAEAILLEHAIDFEAARPALGEVRLQTRRHLRTFLLNNRQHLTADFLNDPRAQRILQKQR